MLGPYDLRQFVPLKDARRIYEVRRRGLGNELSDYSTPEGFIDSLWDCAYSYRLDGWLYGSLYPFWEWLWREELPLEPSPEAVAQMVAHFRASEPLVAHLISLN